MFEILAALWLAGLVAVIAQLMRLILRIFLVCFFLIADGLEGFARGGERELGLVKTRAQQGGRSALTRARRRRSPVRYAANASGGLSWYPRL